MKSDRYTFDPNENDSINSYDIARFFVVMLLFLAAVISAAMFITTLAPVYIVVCALSIFLCALWIDE